ncbi:AAA family ATPase [Pendulispora brunnea]|uniref:AAA family ATPase n=1 Tax=Pendulispora brunnea TaxID=2905690 RepID=A0ABZ2KCR2_9BACT
MPNSHLSREAVRRAISEACEALVDRETLVELVVLCAVAGEHLLVVGPPGTGKSEAVRRIARRLGGRYFEYLIGRFTEPTELFGPINLRKLKEGIVETETAGMLPEAEIAFLDEVFLGSTAILNTLLSLLNERTFRRGHTLLDCPLRVCVGASNRLPEDEQLAAFADRFLVRVFVEPIGDAGLEELLTAGWSLGAERRDPAPATMADVDELARSARTMDLAPVRPAMAHAVRTLRAAGIEWTDRRIVRVQRLVAAAAALAGRKRPSEADLWPMVFALPTEQAQRLGRDVLRDALGAAENESLASAAAEGSLGLRARGAKILQRAGALLEARPSEHETQAWRLQLEGVAREIDATFGKETMPDDVAGLRARVVEILAE